MACGGLLSWFWFLLKLVAFFNISLWLVRSKDHLNNLLKESLVAT